MNKTFGSIFCAVALILAVMSASAFAADPITKPTTNPVVKPIVQPADVAAVKLGKDGMPEAHFIKMHESFLERGKSGKIGVLFLGDSITEGWAGNGKEVWKTSYTGYDPANFGIGGDRTQHVLWRMDNGELDGISPKVVVLMIGTNNIGYSADAITKADVKIVNELHEKLPKTKVLLLAIFPRDEHATAPSRAKIKKVNAELAKLDDGKMTRYLDIGQKFLSEDGTINKDIMKDFLHPTAKGYQIWADAMQPLLDEMMK